MKFYLKINDTWIQPDVDIDTEDGIALNFNFDDLENPTDIISEYSYNLSLPKSAKNNKIFDEYQLLDSTKKFSANETIDYIYISNGDTISHGKCYLDSITKDNYVLALNGSLNIVFNKLLNAGWDTTNVDDDYTLLAEKWSNVLLNPRMIRTSFNRDNISFNIPSLMTNYQRAADYIGFMPTNGNSFSDDFSTDKWLVGTDILPVGDTTAETQNNIETDGLNEHSMAEYRCDQLQPYVYVLRLWQIFARVCESITDYQLVLDNRWFNASYEYLRGLVYTLPKLDTEDVEGSSELYQTSHTATVNTGYTNWYLTDETIVSDDIVTTDDGEYAVFSWDLPITVKCNTGTTDWEKLRWNPYISPYLYVTVTDGTNDYYYSSYIYSMAADDNDSFSDVITAYDSTYSSICQNYTKLKYTASITRDSESGETYCNFGNVTGSVRINSCSNAYLKIRYGYVMRGDANTQPQYRIPMVYTDTVAHSDSLWAEEPVYFYMATNVTYNSVITGFYFETKVMKNMGGGSLLTLERLFHNTTPFSILLKYGKMLGLVWLLDEYSKTLTVMRRSDYIYDCFHTDMSSKSPSIYPYTGYYDITQLADFDNYTVTPLAWETRNVMINFNDCDNDYAKNYLNKYGMTYGSVLIRTDNKLNNDTEMLLCSNEYNTVNPSIITEERVRPISALIAHSNLYAVDNPFAQTIDNCFLFRLSNSTWSANVRYNDWRIGDDGLPYVLISTNTDTELNSGERCWHYQQETNDLITNEMPVFREHNGNGYSILFGEPNEYYYNYDTASKTIYYLYESEWEDYISEVYSSDNKTLDVAAYISGQLYSRLKICPFVSLGNIGYLVCNISDWNDNNRLTNMTLRQITDLERLESKSKSKVAVTNIDTIIADYDYRLGDDVPEAEIDTVDDSDSGVVG